MSYTPEDQYLEPSLQQILDGIRDFSNAVSKRITSGGWKRSHIDEIQILRLELLKLEPALYKLKKEER